jgi:flagellin-like hook-associated protein FlgL
VGKISTAETDTTWVGGYAAGNSAAPAAAELASGNYTMTVTDNTATTFEFEIRDEYGSLVAVNTGVNVVSIAGGATDLEDDAGGVLGITLDGSAGVMTNTSYDFEYIAKNETKVELNKITVSGAAETSTVQTVDADGSDGTNDPTRTSLYVAAAGTYDTGRGFQLTMGAFADIDANDKSRFDLTEAGAVSITLANATDATTLMGTIDTAISTVTASLNSVGSLVARLDKKETAVSVSQVNTEAAYNRIMNADMAYEQVQASKYQILQQTAMAMLSQANMAPQGILSLFR